MPENAPQDIKGSIQKIERIKNQNHIVLYVNSTMVIATQWDVQLNMATVHEGLPSQFVSEEFATIVMTPEHALSLNKALADALRGYENSQGPIRIIKPVIVEPAPISKEP